MALVEPLVMAGERVERHQVEAVTPLPAPDPRFLDKCAGLASTERWRDLPLLLSWEFEQGERRLIAVGNFWERGDCFFRLTADGLLPDRRYVLHEPCARRVYTDDEGRVGLDAGALDGGVLLHVGAMRYAFFVLEPWREGADYGDPVRPREMAAALRARR